MPVQAARAPGSDSEEQGEASMAAKAGSWASLRVSPPVTYTRPRPSWVFVGVGVLLGWDGKEEMAWREAVNRPRRGARGSAAFVKSGGQKG